MRSAGGIKNQLRPIPIFKCRSSCDSRSTGAHRFDDLLRKNREAARPAVIAHAAREFTTIDFNFFPGAIADVCLPEFAATLDFQRATFPKYFEPMKRRTCFDHRDRNVAGGSVSQFRIAESQK